MKTAKKLICYVFNNTIVRNFFIILLFAFVFFVPKTHAATVLDTTTSIVSNDYCLSDDGNDLNCAAYRYYFDTGDGYPIVSSGKLESITLKIHPTQYFYENLSDFVGIKVEGTVLGQHICKSSTITYAYLNEHNNEWITITFYCSPNDTVDFSREKLSVIYSAEYGGSLDFALTTEDLITPSRVPNGNFVATYCYLYPSPWCWWLGPITDRDVWMKITDMPQEATKTPVLIVPGVLGTELWSGNDLIWPDLVKLPGTDDLILLDNLDLDENGNSLNDIQTKDVISKVELPVLPDIDIFDFLTQKLISDNGYALNDSLFFFPYDWRLDLEETKITLDQKIEAIKLQTGAQKVDIIAHSMGGLLTKAYLDTYGKDSVRKLIFVGTPHLGAPKAGKALIEGDSLNVPVLFPSRVKELGRNSPALYELLPNQKYFDTFVGYLRKTKPSILSPQPPVMDYDTTKSFLLDEVNLNGVVYGKAENLFGKHLEDLDFSGIQVYNIAGCKNSTYAGFMLYKDNSIGSLKWTSGDGTVPMVSADYVNIPWTNKYYVKNADHSQLPSADGVRGLISDILSSQAPTLADNMSGSSGFCNFKGKEMIWKSPVEVHIYSQGKHTGPIENNFMEFGIPGVSYDIISEEKFVFLPTDEGQTYDIQSIGLKQGTFDLLISEVDNGNTLNTQVFNDVSINTLTPISFNISETSSDNQIQVNNQTVNASSQLESGEAEDLTPPETTADVSGTAGNSGWYKSDVHAFLNAMDDSSGVLETKYKLDSDVAYQPYTEPISFISEGLHTLEFYSTDNAGNNEAVQTLEIRIDKQTPEFTTWFDFASKTFKFVAEDNLDPNPQITYTASQCQVQDQAGNTTLLNFKQTKILNRYSLILSKISYNGVSTSLIENLFIVGLSGKNLQNSGQAALIKKQQVAAIGFAQDKNESKIVELQSGGNLKIYTLNGLHLIKLKTNKQNINVRIE